MELILFTVPLGMIYNPADIYCLLLFSITSTITSPIQSLHPNTYCAKVFTMSHASQSITSTKAHTAASSHNHSIAQPTEKQSTVAGQTDDNDTNNDNIPSGSTAYTREIDRRGGPGSVDGLAYIEEMKEKRLLSESSNGSKQ